jgi:hypothetical protein
VGSAGSDILFFFFFFVKKRKEKKKLSRPKTRWTVGIFESILFYHPKGLSHSTGMVCGPLVYPHQRAKMRQAEIIFIPTPDWSPGVG